MEETRKLLIDWGLEEEVDTFMANEISADMFGDLDEGLLKELIPKVGPRIKFKRQMNAVKTREHEPDVFPSTSKETTNLDLSDIEMPFSPASTSSTITNATTFSFPLTSDDENILEGTNNAENVATTTQSNLYILNVDSATTVNPEREKIITASQMRDLFNASNAGKSILEVYKHSTFQRAHRQSIADIIIRHEIEGNPDKRISGERMDELSKMIVELFPTEYKEIYFSKERIMKNGKTATLAKGKLVSKFYSLRRSFRDCGLLDKIENETTNAEDDSASEGTHEEIILWLKNSTEPWTTVESNWTKTSKIRTHNLLQPGNLVEYFESFPCLRSEKGYLLLEIDFNISFPDHEMNLFNSWDVVSNKIIEYATRRDVVSKDPIVRNLLEDLKTGITLDARVNVVIILLTYILPTISIKKGKQSGRWRPSRLEVLEGFWLRLKNISELAEAITIKKEKLKKFGLRLQPMIIVVGLTNTEIETIYVRIDDHLFLMPSCLKALDICFKSFHALHAEYATECEQVWTFIQQGIYKLHTKWDKSFTGVNSLLADLKL